MNGPLARSPMAVILASIDGRTTIRASIEGWLREVDGRGEVLVVDASRDGSGDEVEARFPGVRLLRRHPGRLAPELWRDGLEATDAPMVAFSTTQMVPAEGWRRAMIDRLEETGAAAAGGPIEPAPGLGPVDRAVYLLRYVNYLRPFDPARVEPPGDNAAYRRDRLDGLEWPGERGFWEVEVHRALRARGERLAMADGAAVIFEGGSRLAPMLGQRHAHARHYGASRAGRIGAAGRMARLIAAPAIPAVMLRRIVVGLATRGRSLLPWLPAMPYLIPLLAAWALGEARAMGSGTAGARRTIQGEAKALGFRGSLLS